MSQGKSRAANGRSSIYLGKDGYWHGRVTMGVRDDGKPDRRHVKSRNRPAAARSLPRGSRHVHPLGPATEHTALAPGECSPSVLATAPA